MIASTFHYADNPGYGTAANVAQGSSGQFGLLGAPAEKTVNRRRMLACSGTGAVTFESLIRAPCGSLFIYAA